MSRAPRAAQSVACGGRCGSIQSVPADSVWTTSTVRDAAMASRSSPPAGTTKVAAPGPPASGRTSTPDGAAARIPSSATAVTAAIIAPTVPARAARDAADVVVFPTSDG